MTEADLPMSSQIPQNVPPPFGAVPLEEEDCEIPFDQGGVATVTPIQASPTPPKNQKTYVIRGKPNGVSAAEFQQVITDFGNNLSRGKPFKTCDDPDLEGLNVLACYGGYCGDLNCVKCPLRSYCLHV